MTESAVAASKDTEAQARTDRSLFMPSSIVSNLGLSRNPLMGLLGAFRIRCIRILNAGFQHVLSRTLVTLACHVLVLPYFFRTIVTPSFLGLSANPALGVHSKDSS